MKMNFIKKLLTVVLCSFSASILAATIDGKGFQQVKIGTIEGIVLSDGYFHLAPIQPSIAPNIASKQLNDFLESKDYNTESTDLALNILLLKKDDRLILFDSGTGSGMGETGGWLKNNLAMIGVSPEQITDIVLTHAHLDHIGGLLDANGKSVYPNATIYMTKVEHDFWMSENPDFSKSKMNGSDMVATMIKYVKVAVTALKSQIKLVNDKDVLLDCIKVEIAPGHTPGHIVSTIFSNDEKLVAIADLVHSSSILFANPQWGTSFDTDFELGIKTRVAVLKKLYGEKALIFGYHLPYPGIGSLKQLATDSYEWVPKNFATPQLKY